LASLIDNLEFEEAWRTVMQRVMKWMSALIIAFAATNASAVPITFQYSGSCSANCGLIGLGVGDAISGGIVTDTNAFVDNIVSAAEITNYVFNFGTTVFSLANGFISTANLVLNATQDAFISGSITVLNTTAVDRVLAVENTDLWQFTDLNAPSQPMATGSGAFAADPGGPAVPEPGMLALFATGLLALGLRRRRIMPS
jgi:hypothetical protein